MLSPHSKIYLHPKHREPRVAWLSGAQRAWISLQSLGRGLITVDTPFWKPTVGAGRRQNLEAGMDLNLALPASPQEISHPWYVQSLCGIAVSGLISEGKAVTPIALR